MGKRLGRALRVAGVVVTFAACSGSGGSDYLDGSRSEASSSNGDGQGDDTGGSDAVGSDAEGTDSGGGTGCNPSSCKPCVLGMASCSSAGTCQCCVGTTCI